LLNGVNLLLSFEILRNGGNRTQIQCSKEAGLQISSRQCHARRPARESNSPVLQKSLRAHEATNQRAEPFVDDGIFSLYRRVLAIAPDAEEIQRAAIKSARHRHSSSDYGVQHAASTRGRRTSDRGTRNYPR
jgi:prophage tail gpP-like protein